MRLGDNSNPSNDQLLQEFLSEINDELTQAQNLVNETKQDEEQYQSDWQHWRYLIAIGSTKAESYYENVVVPAKQALTNTEAQLDALDPMFDSFTSTLNLINQGIGEVRGNANSGEDQQMFDDIMDKMSQAILLQYKADLFLTKMEKDAGNNQKLVQDAMIEIKLSSEASGVANALKTDISNDLVTLDQQKNAAEEDLNHWRWYHDLDPVTGIMKELAEAHDRAVIKNSDEMSSILTSAQTSLSPLFAILDNNSYAMLAVYAQQMLKQVEKLLENIDPKKLQGDLRQINQIMALVLGFLSQVMSVSASQKAEDAKKEEQATNTTTLINLNDESTALKELQDDLAYANAMQTVMTVSKALLEFAMALAMPGVGGVAMGLLFATADTLGLTNKLTDYLAKNGFGNVGAQIAVGGAELVATLGGAYVLDQGANIAAKEAADATEKQLAKESQVLIDKTVAKVLAKTDKVGDEAAAKRVEEVVSQAVQGAIRGAARKSVQMTSQEAGAGLLVKLGKAGWKEGSVSYTQALQKLSEERGIQAARDAAQMAAQDIEFLAEASAQGATITKQEIAAVSDRAANSAIAKLSNIEAKDVTKKTAYMDKSDGYKASVRAGYVAGYNVLSDNGVSFALAEVVEGFKKMGAHVNEDKFQQALEFIKLIEKTLAMLVMFQGAGGVDSIGMDARSLALKASTLGMALGTLGEAVADFGTADAEKKQAVATKKINDFMVSCKLLETILNGIHEQSKISSRNARNRFMEQASNYQVLSQIENNGQELAKVLSQQAV